MSWGIAKTASDFEKIRAESADYLNGLSSCGEIEESTYSESFDFYHDLLERAYKQGIADSRPRGEWISCTEMLPAVRQNVLCQCRAGILDVLRLTENGDWEQLYPHALYFDSFVVAWMPLPEPWEGADDE